MLVVRFVDMVAVLLMIFAWVRVCGFALVEWYATTPEGKAQRALLALRGQVVRPPALGPAVLATAVSLAWCYARWPA